MTTIRYSASYQALPQSATAASSPHGERVPSAGNPTLVPRVRDTEASTERPLQSYPAIKRARVPEELTDALLLAPRKGNYEHVARQQMIICMGVTVEGYKRLLGFTEATTEHSTPTGELFRGLLEPGLRFAGGVLCVMDGRKGPENHQGRLRLEGPRAALPAAWDGRMLWGICRRPTGDLEKTLTSSQAGN